MLECPKEEKSYRKCFSVFGDLVTEQMDTKSTTHQEITEKLPKETSQTYACDLIVNPRH